MLLTALLSSILAVAPLTAAEVTPGSIINESNRKHAFEYLEESLKPEKSVPKAKKWLASQTEDGTWADVDYESRGRSAWDAAKHAYRFADLAKAWYATRDEGYLDAARKALRWWADKMPVCPNWWFNEIGVPRAMGPSMVLIKSRLSEEDIACCVKILSKASFKYTGQNKIWVAESVLVRGIMQGDEPLVKAARDTIISEIRVSDDVEGLQPDYSFHQHGPQLQIGNYGLSFASNITEWIKAFDGTTLAVSEEQREIMEKYVSETLCRVVWNGYFDFSACGRQVFKGQQKSKARSVAGSMKNLGLEEKDLSGACWYPYSDFAVYRGDDWYASVRMQSNRVKGYEYVNSENMMSYFSSDGAVLVRRDGDEYDDVSGVWNWLHIPGVTCYDDGKDLYNRKNGKFPYNKTDKVFASADGDRMAVAMEINRDGLSARKAWFFFPDGYVCLGAGISREAEDDVTTAVEQCNVKDDALQTGARAASHNGVSYISLDGKFKYAPLEHVGDWKKIFPSKKSVMDKKNLLDIYIDHGKSPKNASYAYVVIPNGSTLSAAGKFVKKNVKILSNTTTEQSVMVGGVRYVIDWVSCKASCGK